MTIKDREDQRETAGRAPIGRVLYQVAQPKGGARQADAPKGFEAIT
jgi:hypothetical protein